MQLFFNYQKDIEALTGFTYPVYCFMGHDVPAEEFVRRGRKFVARCECGEEIGHAVREVPSDR